MSEIYAKARQSTDLAMEQDKLKAADALAAFGMAGQKHRLGSLLLACIAEYPSGVSSTTSNATIEAVLALARKRGLGHQMALVILWSVIDPACDHCHGRGYEVEEGTNRLSDRACWSCEGTGQKQVPGGDLGKDFREELHGYIRAVTSAGLHKLYG